MVHKKKMIPFAVAVVHMHLPPFTPVPSLLETLHMVTALHFHTHMVTPHHHTQIGTSREIHQRERNPFPQIQISTKRRNYAREPKDSLPSILQECDDLYIVFKDSNCCNDKQVFLTKQYPFLGDSGTVSHLLTCRDIQKEYKKTCCTEDHKFS